MRLGYVIVYVENVKITVDFYGKVFGLPLRFLHESGCYAELETGQTALAFVEEAMAQKSHSFRMNRAEKEAAGWEICLVSEHVKRDFERAVSEGAKAVVEPTLKPWGQLVAYVKDNNGCLIEICSPLS